MAPRQIKPGSVKRDWTRDSVEWASLVKEYISGEYINKRCLNLFSWFTALYLILPLQVYLSLDCRCLLSYNVMSVFFIFCIFTVVLIESMKSPIYLSNFACTFTLETVYLTLVNITLLIFRLFIYFLKQFRMFSDCSQPVKMMMKISCFEMNKMAMRQVTKR